MYKQVANNHSTNLLGYKKYRCNLQQKSLSCLSNGTHDFTRVSHLSPSKLWMLSVLWPHDFILVSHLSPTCLRVSSGCSECSVRMMSHLSPTCLPVSSGCSVRFVSHLSPSKLSHSVLWPHDFTLVSHLSPTCLPVSSGCSECSGRMILYVCPICFPLVSQ